MNFSLVFIYSPLYIEDPSMSDKESLKDVFGIILDLSKDDQQVVERRASRVRELENNADLKKFPVSSCR